MTDKRNISTEHQRPGDAARPDDTMDRDQPYRPEDEQRDRGKRPFIADNGEVRGSGSGAGGGNPGEDFDDDPDAGGGNLTEARDASPGEEDRIHQAVENQSSVSPDDYPESERAR